MHKPLSKILSFIAFQFERYLSAALRFHSLQMRRTLFAKMFFFLSTQILFGSIIDVQCCSGVFVREGHLRVEQSYRPAALTSQLSSRCGGMTVAARLLR